MLWNPKHDEPKVTYDRRSLASLIAWLETKDPNEKYQYGDVLGGCLLGQFLQACGYKRVNVSGHFWGWDYWKTEESLPHHFDHIAVHAHPRTFGAALKIAKEFA